MSTSNQLMLEGAVEAIGILQRAINHQSTRPLEFADAIHSLCRAVDVLSKRPGVTGLPSEMLMELEALRIEVRQLKGDKDRLNAALLRPKKENQ